MYEKDEDSYDNSEVHNRTNESVMDRVFQNRKNIPVKKHISKIEEFIVEIRKDVGENKKFGQILRSEILTLEHKGKEKCNSVTKIIMEDFINLEKEFKKIIESDQIETDFIKSEIQKVTIDKCKIDQNRICLESRLKECENDVGFDLN